jgi:hypothetical protein
VILPSPMFKHIDGEVCAAAETGGAFRSGPIAARCSRGARRSWAVSMRCTRAVMNRTDERPDSDNPLYANAINAVPGSI